MRLLGIVKNKVYNKNMKQTKYSIYNKTPRRHLLKYLITALIVLTIAGLAAYFTYSNSKPTQTNVPGNTGVTNDNKATEQEEVIPEEEQDIPENTDAVIEDFKFITENEQFKIRQIGNDFTITLYPIINRPDQRDMYLDQLREYKQNSLDYLKNNGFDRTKGRVIFEPNEAQNL